MKGTAAPPRRKRGGAFLTHEKTMDCNLTPPQLADLAGKLGFIKGVLQGTLQNGVKPGAIEQALKELDEVREMLTPRPAPNAGSNE